MPFNEKHNEPAVQTYMSLLQATITRMAANSSNCKGWCVTLVSALIVLAADKQKPGVALIALAPLLIFMSLDCMYLALETHYRDKYNEFLSKLNLGEVPPTIFNMNADDTVWFRLVFIGKQIISWSITPVYFMLGSSIFVAYKTITTASV